jgi:hypothetical protein
MKNLSKVSIDQRKKVLFIGLGIVVLGIVLLGVGIQ